jgi:hypothetical protein
MSQSSKSDSNSQDYSDSQIIINSLEQTIDQLQKALLKINQVAENDSLPNLTIVKKIVDSSNELINSLEANLTLAKPKDSEQEIPREINNDDNWNGLILDQSLLNQEQTDKSSQGRKPQKIRKKNQTIPIIIITLVISTILLSLWWFDVFPLANRKNNNIIPDQKIVDLTQQNNTIINQPEQQVSEEINKLNQQEILSEKPPLSTEKPELINQDLDSQQFKQDKKPIENNLTSEITSLPLTPEQSLIQSIENQVVEITQKYGENLIVGINADFGNNYLLIILNSEWYNLSNNQQDNLIRAIFSQAKTIDFKTLQVKDTHNNLLARSAFIGDEVIIIKRK